MITSGHLQTDSADNRGVKLNSAGITAFDDSGKQTVKINANGEGNYFTGTLATSSNDEPGVTIYTDIARGPAGSRSLELLARQAVHVRAELVATSGTAEDAQRLRELIEAAASEAGATGYTPQIAHGAEASVQAAAHPADTVLNGITGSIGLEPTLTALNSGYRVALANKESLIAGGPLVRAAVDASPLDTPMVPVDSEHSALAQALASGTDAEIDRLILTASGGPFRGYKREQLHDVTPAQALAHPTWDMGLVVTTNSATMVNKALEVLEAHHLFGVDLDRIDVAVHPQSVVHSMVQFVDGSTIAQASPPSMVLPIALGLTWPHRIPGAGPARGRAKAAPWAAERVSRTVRGDSEPW